MNFISENIWQTFIIAAILLLAYLLFEISNKRKDKKELLYFFGAVYACSCAITFLL